MEKARARYRALEKAIAAGLVRSCHDCSDGGLGVALAETAFAGDMGMVIDLDVVPSEGIDRLDYLLFSESQSRFVVTVRPADTGRFEEIMAGTDFASVGRVNSVKYLVMGYKAKTVMNEPVDELRAAWQRPLAW